MHLSEESELVSFQVSWFAADLQSLKTANLLQIVTLQIEFVECDLDNLILFALKGVQETADVVFVGGRPVR